MAFPTTGILDNFNRANAATLGANYSSTGDTYRHGILSNQCKNQSGAWAGDYYNAATYANCEFYFTIVSGAANSVTQIARLADLGSGGDGYLVYWTTGVNTHRIYRVDNGVSTQLGATITQALSNGDSIGIECSGSNISAYRKASGGAWGSLATRSDATYSAAGYFAFQDATNGNIYDDLGGGTIVVPATRLVTVRALLGVGL